jgi:hypothetical protein
MATWRTNDFSKDLYRSAREQLPMITEPDMNHDENDQMYWLVWLPDITAKLAAHVDAQQLAAFLDEIASLAPCQRYHRIASAYHLQRAAELQCLHLHTSMTHTSRMEQGEATVREHITCDDCGEEIQEGIAGLASEYEMEIPY